MANENIRPQSIENFSSGNFWVIYGRNSSGKTHFIGTFPDLLVVVFKDQGLETLKGIPGAQYIELKDKTPEALIEFCKLYKESPYKTIAFDTFGVWQDELLKQIKTSLKVKNMTQNMWGNFGDLASDVLMAMKELSETKIVIASFHEQPETVEGYENEITPNISVAVYGNVIKKTLYGIANYVVHTFLYDYVDPNTMKSTFYFACHTGVNPYYWTKFQTQYKVPEIVFNPSYEEMVKIKNGVHGK